MGDNYASKLLSAQVTLSSNELFYMGDTRGGAMIVTIEVARNLSADRASIWLYNQDRSSIVLKQLYISSEDTFYQDTELKREDFEEYFAALEHDPIIVADDAETHPATSCFLEGYLKPLGVKSMLDVPIWYRGSLIGVICIESLSPRKWMKEEVDFAQVLSSMYSFSHSVSQTNELLRNIKEFEDFVDASVLISKADAKGKITYVNKKFTTVSGWNLEEAMGKDHNIVNSGEQPDGYWGKMYSTVLAGNIWSDVVANRAKDGSLYYVDTYIKADFDENQKLKGFLSIRQDVTELKRKEAEIRNRMDAINKSNAVIEFDLEGNIIFANHLFLETMGYSSQEEIVGKPHSIFVHDDYVKSEDYSHFWKRLNDGEYFHGEVTRIKKDGSLVHLQATYNPISDTEGKIYRIMKIATDISLSYEQRKEIEKKNTYLEHAAKILRHDMHSGINTYMPRGLSSLDRRLSDDIVKELKIEAPIKMIKEGLRHTQKVYKGVYEFTNLVKKDVVLSRTDCDLKTILEDYLSSTAYRPQVVIEDLGTLSVNEPLFCTAIDNLIRNGLKYNDSNSKLVTIKKIGNEIHVEDNGRGLSREEFKYLSQPYVRKEGQKESGSGLGLNICIAILEEHGFNVDCEKREEGGSRLKIKVQ